MKDKTMNVLSVRYEFLPRVVAGHHDGGGTRALESRQKREGRRWMGQREETEGKGVAGLLRGNLRDHIGEHNLGKWLALQGGLGEGCPRGRCHCLSSAGDGFCQDGGIVGEVELRLVSVQLRGSLIVPLRGFPLRIVGPQVLHMRRQC